MKKLVMLSTALILGAAFLLLQNQPSAQAQEVTLSNVAMIALGRAIFFDADLSVNGTQACADCHGPEVGFSGPDYAANAGGSVYQGALPNRFGNRMPPTAAYAGYNPVLYYDEQASKWFGGLFWDGRATGLTLGDPLAEQAQGPFLNPLEHALPNTQALCTKVKRADYAGLFQEVWGAGSLDCARDANGVYERVARSIAAYERSPEVSPFTSKFDLFWDAAAAAGRDVTLIKCGMGGGGGGMGAQGCGGGGMDPNRWTTFRNLGLTDAELRGLAAFNDPNRADCASCHSLEPTVDGYPVFTNYGYDNIGLPRNPENPFYTMPPEWNPDGENWVDYGLGGYLQSAGYAPEVYEPELGKFKVPTLRNVDLRPGEGFMKAYGHNGYFKSLEDIIFFYHWRGMMDGNCMGMGCGSGMITMFPPPEVDQNRAALPMFPRPLEDDIVAFLKTLSDGYFVR